MKFTMGTLYAIEYTQVLMHEPNFDLYPTITFIFELNLPNVLKGFINLFTLGF